MMVVMTTALREEAFDGPRLFCSFWTRVEAGLESWTLGVSHLQSSLTQSEESEEEKTAKHRKNQKIQY
jgi:hypothetical protein